MKRIIILFTIALSQHAIACQFDTDCQAGSVCVKAQYRIYGACVGPNEPTVEEERKGSTPDYHMQQLTKPSQSVLDMLSNRGR